MKKIFLFFTVSLLLSFTTDQTNTVYLCNNGDTEVFHRNKNCHGLKRCDHEVIQLTESEAKGKGKRKRLCGYED